MIDAQIPNSQYTYMIQELTQQLRALGVRAGGVLLVHTSFRAVCGRNMDAGMDAGIHADMDREPTHTIEIEGGPLGLIAALEAALGPTGTLVMPTMTDGEDVFDPTQTPTCGMGITAELFWRMTGTIRSTHPGGSFAARGPHAHAICAEQPLSPPHGHDSPVGRVYDLGGQILLLGVTHSENTSLHLAESLAQVPYAVTHPCVIGRDPATGLLQSMDIAETDHCCQGFRIADTWLRTRQEQREGRIGATHARLCDSQTLVPLAVQYLRENPLLFLCTEQEDYHAGACEECEAARASVVV